MPNAASELTSVQCQVPNLNFLSEDLFLPQNNAHPSCQMIENVPHGQLYYKKVIYNFMVVPRIRRFITSRPLSAGLSMI